MARSHTRGTATMYSLAQGDTYSFRGAGATSRTLRSSDVRNTYAVGTASREYVQRDSVSLQKTDQVRRQVVSDDSAWVSDNYEELLQRYQNQWIAVKAKQVVAHASNPQVMLKKIQQAGVDTPYVRFMQRVKPRIEIAHG
jgi:hypothetical protein